MTLPKSEDAKKQLADHPARLGAWIAVSILRVIETPQKIIIAARRLK